MTMKLEKVDKIWLQDGKTYTGWGYYNDIGNFIPQGCGKKYYNDYYVYGNYKNGILNGPAIESHNTYMKTIQFKDNNGNGWGLCINRGMLIEFGYYRDCKLKTNLIDFVYWYYTKLEDSGRASQNMLSMYTFNDTKEVAELLIGYKGGTTTFGLSVPFMGFRFKPDGSVWVGDTATRKLSGTLIHFCPNGEIEAGFFVDGILKRRMGIQNILNAYFFEEEDRSAFKNIPDVIINHNYFESFGEDSIYHLKKNTYTMDYHVLELAYNGSSEFNKIDKELWKIGDKVIITPHGNLNIINAVFVDQGNLVGIELQVNGKINFGEFRGITKREKIVSINTFAVMRQPNNAWLWIYAFDEIGNPVATFCGHDNIDGLFHYVRRMKCIYKKYGEVDKCVLHMFDRNIDIEYMTDRKSQSEDKTITNELDTYDLKPYRIDNFDFTSHNFIEYENGKIKARENSTVKIIVNNEYSTNKYSVSISGNGIKDKINLEFEFDACIGCNDRLLLYSLPKETNANIIVMTVLQNICPYTRNRKIYSATEPVVCSIFTNQGHLVKLSFTFANPERLIEFYL